MDIRGRNRGSKNRTKLIIFVTSANKARSKRRAILLQRRSPKTNHIIN